MGARIREQTFGFGAQHLGAADLTAVRARPQLGVGRRVPEKQREARRERVIVERARLVVEKHVAGRGEHRGVAGEHRLGE